MHIITHQPADGTYRGVEPKTCAPMVVALDGMVATSFAWSADLSQNIAGVYMTAAEARRYAVQLLMYAEKIDPTT